VTREQRREHGLAHARVRAGDDDEALHAQMKSGGQDCGECAVPLMITRISGILP
jgi:hypothetical protein